MSIKRLHRILYLSRHIYRNTIAGKVFLPEDMVKLVNILYSILKHKHMLSWQNENIPVTQKHNLMYRIGLSLCINDKARSFPWQ